MKITINEKERDLLISLITFWIKDMANRSTDTQQFQRATKLLVKIIRFGEHIKPLEE